MQHLENNVLIKAGASEIFDFVDDHTRFSSHMSSSSWMMGGGRMEVSVDEKEGKEVGSHIRLGGTALGFSLAVDEIVTRREPPHIKEWETVGTPNLLVIGYYKMKVCITEEPSGCLLNVSIDYDLPKRNAWVGRLFGRMYAAWCVKQMTRGTYRHFIR